MALDHRHYGQSGGEPRQYEHHGHKVEDLRAELDALAEHEAVDAGRLGAVGVCLGTGYVMWASVDNPRVRAIAGVAGYYRDTEQMRANDPEGFDAKVAQGIAAREHYQRTGEVITIPAVALEGDAAMTLRDTFDYYGTPRAGVPNYTNAFAVMSREHFLPFDVQRAAPRIAAPVLMIHSERALSPQWARRYHDALTVPKAMHWVESKGQTDFYDHPRLVEESTDRIAEHLHTHLG
ncbi:MAG: dienelactone hydrolase family protein [Myxococcota bacterium]